MSLLFFNAYACLSVCLLRYHPLFHNVNTQTQNFHLPKQVCSSQILWLLKSCQLGTTVDPLPKIADDCDFLNFKIKPKRRSASFYQFKAPFGSMP